MKRQNRVNGKVVWLDEMKIFIKREKSNKTKLEQRLHSYDFYYFDSADRVSYISMPTATKLMLYFSQSHQDLIAALSVVN